MTKSFLEVRKFAGDTLVDVVNYLKRDLSKGLQDAFAILSQKSKDQVFQSLIVSGKNMGATTVIFNIGQIILPKGTHHLTASAFFQGLATSNKFVIAKFWMTAAGTGVSAVPSDVLDGYNGANINAATTTDSGADTDVHAYDDVTFSCQWLLELRQEATIYLQAQATYSGAGTPTYNAAMVSHGYVME